MCTVLVLQHIHPKYPMVIAANRDEYYARPSTEPQLLSDKPRIAAGRDGTSAGTWMGLTESGFFVGITNQRTYFPANRSLRSRGEVVLATLRAGSAPEAERYLAQLDPQAYNPFNLIYGNAQGLFIAYARHDVPSIAIAPVPDGIHVLPNDQLDSPKFPKVHRVTNLALPVARQPWPDLVAALGQTLSDHALPSLESVPLPPPTSPLTPELLCQLQAVCVHTPMYGTHSATIVALVPGNVAHYVFAKGPACRTAFQDFTHLVN